MCSIEMIPDVQRVIEASPPEARAGMLKLRDIIFEVADELPQIGRVEEALRWGQPAYLTPDTGAASTLRIGVPKTGAFGLFVHCRTSLIADFRLLAGDVFRFEGRRAVVFDGLSDIRPDLLSLLIRRALTYHLRD